MANRVKDCGVPQDPAADIIAVPVVTDIGVPTSIALVTPFDEPTMATDVRHDTLPDARQNTDIGDGVPNDVIDGVVST